MPNLLGDIFSFGNKVKRSVRGLLDDPSGEMDVRMRRMAEDIGGTEHTQNALYQMMRGNVMHDPEAAAYQRALINNNALNVAFAGIVAPGYRKGLISSQRYLDDDIVKAKMDAGDFDVRVSPEFVVDGEKLAAIIDGHHALAAANRALKKPNFIEVGVKDNDTIGLLQHGQIDDFLETQYIDSPWHYVENGRDVW